MEDNKKYNKRRRSYTDFRSSYSDNKKYFISTDKESKGMSVLKYFLITAAVIVFILAGFLITDALLDISEKPYDSAKVTTTTAKSSIDNKYFQNQITVPADKVNEDKENNPLE